MPKAFPDFQVAADRYLDLEMSAAEKRRFLDQLMKNRTLQEELRKIKFARQALLVYKLILPPAKEFARIRKSILSQF